MPDFVKISDSIDSDSSVVAASSKAVSSVYDKAIISAVIEDGELVLTYGDGTVKRESFLGNTLDNYVDLSSDQTITGTKTFSSLKDADDKYIIYNYYRQGRGTNVIPPEGDTTEGWKNYSPGHYWYNTAGILTDQPNQYGHLLHLGNGTEVFQIWCTAPSGPLHFRSGNASGWNGGSNNVVWKDLTADAKVTNTLATTTKAYVTGTTSSTTNTGTQVFDTGVYLGTTAGYLHVTRLVFSNGAQLWVG